MNRTLRPIAWALMIPSLVAHAAEGQSPSEPPPNVVVILADDAGWGDVAIHGNPNLQTPNLDQLARQGARLERFSVCPVCAPTRAEFLTGRYHPRSGVHDVTRGGERIDAGEITIADHFRAAGYRTGVFGKWHNGTQWPYHPLARGFDEFYGFTSGHWASYFDAVMDHNGRLVRGRGYMTDDLTDHAIDWIDADSQQPFFAYLAINTPHSPMQVPETYFASHRDQQPVPDPRPDNAAAEDVAMTRAALAMVENIDANVGRLLQRLRDRHLDRDTIVVYFSDNGPNSHRFNGGLRGRKGSTTEGGVRSPCFIRYPAKLHAGTRFDSVTGAVDLLPTLADLAGIDLIDHHPSLDGISLADNLIDGRELDPSRTLVAHWNGRFSVASDGFRFHDDGRLFDVRSDPGEHHDVAGQHPRLATRLMDQLNQYRQSTGARPRGEDDRPIVLGHPEAVTTPLPIRDATLVGCRRNSVYANSTHVIDWDSTEDRIEWSVHVPESSRQRVTMYYATSDRDVGDTVVVRLGNQQIDATITVPNVAPETGSRRDRVPRIEGYERRWRTMDLGEMTLTAGDHDLTLSATHVTGGDVAMVRWLVFEPRNEPPTALRHPPASRRDGPNEIFNAGGRWNR